MKLRHIIDCPDCKTPCGALLAPNHPKENVSHSLPSDCKLAASNISLTIDQQTILSEITVSVKAGSILGVIGPNGAGKTSLLRILSGQISSIEQVNWKNKALSDYDPKSLAQQIAVVNQLNDSVIALNLWQIVAMGLLPHQSLLSRYSIQDKQDINQALCKVGLQHKASQVFSSLSGGEQQRGLIARALVQKASLIILDEPVNHLDIYYQHQVLGMLGSIAASMDVAIVMSLHDVNLAANYCDQLSLLHQGRQISYGSPKQVLTAKNLEKVYKLPCEVTEDPQAGLRVDFYPPFKGSQKTRFSEGLYS